MMLSRILQNVIRPAKNCYQIMILSFDQINLEERYESFLIHGKILINEDSSFCYFR